MLRAQANPDCAFPDAVQVLSREILRMRRDCPPTAEVERMRNALMACAKAAYPTTFAPLRAGDVHIDFLCEDVQKEVGHLRADRDAWKHKVDSMGGDLNRIRSLVPTASDEQTTFDAVQAELQRLHAELGRQARDEWKAAADERAKLLDRLHAILFCTFPAEPTMEKQAEKLVAAAKNGAPPVVGDCLLLAHKPGEWSQEADEFFVYRRVSRTPWVQVFWRHGPGISNSDNNDHMAIDTFLRRCGVDMSKAEGVPGVHWVRAAADCIKGAGIEAQTAIAEMAEDVDRAILEGAPRRGSWADHLHVFRLGTPEGWRHHYDAAGRAEKRKLVLEELRQVVNRNSLEGACGDTPDFILAEVMMDAAIAFGRFTRGRDAHATGRASRVGPATGQPGTEVPLAADGSGTVVELGEAFRQNLSNAVACLPSDGHPIDAATVKIAIRNLRAAVEEMAKVVGAGHRIMEAIDKRLDKDA